MEHPARGTKAGRVADGTGGTYIIVMSKTTQRLAVGLGVIAAGHYVASPYFSFAADAPDSPPLASITALSTGTGTVSAVYIPVTIDAITDAEYAYPGRPGLTVTVFGKV
jgi:hypothetical protein